MNPFKSKIPVVQNVIFENDGDTVTIIHSKGAFKFNKEDVLESHFSCDIHSTPKMNVSLFHFDPKSVSGILVVLFWGGWMNTLLVFNSVYSNIFSKSNVWIWFLFAILLTFPTLFVFRFLVKLIHITFDREFPVINKFKSLYDSDLQIEYKKDILNINLHNLNFRVRFEWYNRGIKEFNGDYSQLKSWYKSLIDLGYIKEHISNRKSNISDKIFIDRQKFLFYKRLLFITLILIVLFTRWDMPFILREFIDNRIKFIFPEFPTIGNLNSEEGKILFKEYVHNSNIFLAFYDGMVGVLFNVVTVFLAVISFIWPIIIAISMVVVMKFVFKISLKYILIPSILLFLFYLVCLLFLYPPKEMVYYWKLHFIIGFIIGVILLCWIMLVETNNFKKQDN